MRRLVTVGLMFFCASAVFAQSFDAAQSFDVASIKPAAPMGAGKIMVGMRGGPGSNDPGHLTINNMSLSDLIQYAYNVKAYQVQGPDWMQSTRFDVQAIVPSGATKDRAQVMMQNLLAERFKLVVHHSSKEQAIFALVVAKGGPKLKESAPDPTAPNDAPPSDDRRPSVGKDGMPQMPPGALKGGGVAMMMAPGGRMRMMANGVTVAKFVEPLGMQLDRPVVDMTGLTGTYDITLDFAPDPDVMRAKMAAMGAAGPPLGVGGPPDGASPSADAPAATLFSALPDQLGLRLEARKGPVDLVIVDSVQKTPTEN